MILTGLGPGVPPVHHLEHPVVDVLERHVQVRQDLGTARQDIIKVVGEVVRVVVEDPDPVEPVDLVELAEQLGQPGPPVQVHAVIGHVLGDQVQLADAVGGEFAGLLDDALDRLGDVLAPHVGDRAEGAEAVAPLGHLEVGQMFGGDPEPGPVVLRLDRGGPEDGPLLVEVAHDPVGDLGDLLAAEDADDLVDLGHLVQEHLALAFGQAAGDDHPLDLPEPLAVEHLADHPERLLPRGVDESAGVDDDQVGPLRVRHQGVPVLRQQPEHPLGVDEVLGAAEADEGEGAFEVGRVHRFMIHAETEDSR